MRVFYVIFAVLITLSLTGNAVARSAVFHVATDGNDAWSGTKATHEGTGDAGPFRTLGRARDAVRQLKQDTGLSAAGVVVEIAPGTYTLSESFTLTKEDSGTKGAPITYRATRGDVHLIGGKTVDGFRPVSDSNVLARLDATARQSVLELHLSSAGVTDFGHIAGSGFARNVPLAHLEVFFDGLPMRLAEWPNGDWTSIASVPKGEKIVDSSGKPRGTRTDRFHYDGNRPERWKSFDDVWVHGYWFVDWADQYLKVKTIDLATRAVVIESPQSGYGYKKGQRFRFLNIIEELDRPGEYYVDRKSGMLYVWPPEEATRNVATVSLLTEPLIVLRNTSYVRMIGLTIEGGRSDGVVVQGGEGVLLAGCTIGNLGGAAVRINGGANHRVQSCDLGHLGDGGILIEGGSRRTLTPAGHVADNNHIHDYSRWVRTYRVGVRLSGVGLQASRNYIHNAPHSGIIYSGNDHVIEYNELAELCLDTGDVGGIYTGRDWAARGTQLRFNHIHHLGGLNMGSNAIYLDDLASGQTIHGNIIHDVWRAMMIGGGRDNVVENNIFADYKIGIHFDARGIGWSRRLIEGRQGSWNMFGKLESVPYNRPPYSTKYPQLPNILNEMPLEPKDNRIASNIFVGEPWLDPRGFKLAEAEQRGWVRITSNLVGVDPGFLDREGGDFRLAEDSPARQIGFQEIPTEKIGLRLDEYRRELPGR
jgi:hypothetical protein